MHQRVKNTIKENPTTPLPAFLITLGLIFLVSGCQKSTASAPPRDLTIHQNWELKPGSLIAGHRISGGLGDVSIEVKGDPLYAPFSGTLQPHQTHCAIFSSPELPAYLLRFCDIDRPQWGDLRQGDRMGTGKTLQFAALRKQPSGEWTLVEPASDILERIFIKP